MAEKIKIAGVVRLDEPMRGHTSFRIGGPADLYAAPDTFEELRAVLSLFSRERVPCFLLGGGTNILVSDKGIRGAVVDLNRLSGMEARGERVTALCGAPVSAVSELALSHGLAGLEFAYCLPGSVGGAVWMNARCYDREVSDVLVSTESLAWAPASGEGPGDDLFLLSEKPLDCAVWGYKKSPFQRSGEVILRASFRLPAGDPRAIEAAMSEHRRDRERKGHFLFPCAGSIFKNNREFGVPTGKLIDSLGLKGRRIGNAQIAPFHGNIIVNTAEARAEDVLALIELVEEEVEKRLGFRLEREVLVVGEWNARNSRSSAGYS